MTTPSNLNQTSLSNPILPNATLGVMGGGQLGRMFAHAAQQLGYDTAVLDEAENSPAGNIAHHHIKSSYSDDVGLKKLWQTCAAITTEFENVPAQSLQALAHHVPVYPKADAVSIAQDRTLEKQLFIKSGVGCVPHAVIANKTDIAKANESLFPAILKTTRLGYDGKGQVTVTSKDQLQAAWGSLNTVECLLEKRVDLDSEISVLIARGANGETVHYPVQNNLHRNGILAITEVPNQAPTQLQKQVIDAAKQLAQSLDYVGVLCIEFFILKDGSFIANEIAPRPHNSAHWTMNACSYSQFEAQVRTLVGLPLPEPIQHSDAIMLNLLGDLWFDTTGKLRSPAWDQILTLPGTHLHLYGKTEAKKERKMGHLNITASSFEQAKTTALKAAKILGIPAW